MSSYPPRFSPSTPFSPSLGLNLSFDTIPFTDHDKPISLNGISFIYSPKNSPPALALSEKSILLYPTSRLFPVDEVCEKIVRALEVRGWSIPGVTVTFSDINIDYGRFKWVSQIKGPDFTLTFGRPQGNLTSVYKDVAAVRSIEIGKDTLKLSDSTGKLSYTLLKGSKITKDVRISDPRIHRTDDSLESIFKRARRQELEKHFGYSQAVSIWCSEAVYITECCTLVADSILNSSPDH